MHFNVPNTTLGAQQAQRVIISCKNKRKKKKGDRKHHTTLGIMHALLLRYEKLYEYR